MEAITHRSKLKSIAEKLKAKPLNLDEQVTYIHRNVLKKKVKFPLLEYFTLELTEVIPASKQVPFLDQIVALEEIGSYTIAGKLLQLRLQKHTEQSLKKAEEYIIAANKWYACDIIGERVFGHALLHDPGLMFPKLKKLAKHPDPWMQRTIGVAGHYAIKKGLKKEFVTPYFKLLLTLSGSTDLHTKKGIGWAAKTSAKFHPDIIHALQKEIDTADIKQWFKTKLKIGLGRSAKYAGRHRD